jgi:NAD(P)-dependent dehydrogenase (short-subunit alcohol dehydrogenase family)
MNFSFDNKKVLVTGAAQGNSIDLLFALVKICLFCIITSGIGEAIALALVQNGAQVVALDFNHDLLQKLKAEVCDIQCRQESQIIVRIQSKGTGPDSPCLDFKNHRKCQ